MAHRKMTAAVVSQEALAAALGADLCQIYTDVDGVYTADPRKDPNAKRYRTISYIDALKDELKVADATAFSMCMENGMPILVFDSHAEGNIVRACQGEDIGTVVGRDIQTEFYA